MNAEILAVGTEILLGDILNTNAQFLSKELAILGIGVYYQTVVGDNPKRLENALKIAFDRSDIVITTGGLGPTDDDLTKETGAKFFGLEMVQNEEALLKLKEYFKDRNMPKTNLKQSYVPKGSIVLKNNNGTAPGCIIEKNGKILIMLPGPPNETEPLFKEQVLPFLLEKQEYTLVSRVLKLSGIGEAAAAEAVRDIMNESENPTIAPYAKQNEMLFRITARGKTEEEAEKLLNPFCKEVYNRLGEYIYGEGEITLEQAVINLLEKKGYTLAAAESCTGGMLSSRIIDSSGASSVFLEGIVTYSNESKKLRLGVKNETLEKYGAVSEQTASEMAEGVCRLLNTDVGISTTGIAGPNGGTAEKPVGLVYVGICIKGKIFVYKYNLNGSRNKIRSRVVTNALDELRKLLSKENS